MLIIETWYKKCLGYLKKRIQSPEDDIRMVAYEVFSYDEENGYDFIGILPERRKDPKRITKESVLNWGRMILGSNADGKKILFKSVTIEDTAGEMF